MLKRARGHEARHALLDAAHIGIELRTHPRGTLCMDRARLPVTHTTEALGGAQWTLGGGAGGGRRAHTLHTHTLVALRRGLARRLVEP